MKNAKKLFACFSVVFLSVCTLASCFTITDSKVSEIISELSSIADEQSSKDNESSTSLDSHTSSNESSSEVESSSELTSSSEVESSSEIESSSEVESSSEIESSSEEISTEVDSSSEEISTEIGSSETATGPIQTETEIDTSSQESNTETQESTDAPTQTETATGPIQTETETENGNTNTDTGSGQEGGGETLPTLQEQTQAVYRQAVSVGYTGDYETFLANIVYHSVGKISGLTKYEVKNIPVDKYVFDISGDEKHKTRDIFVTHKRFSDFTNEEHDKFYNWYFDEYGVADLHNGFDENVTNLGLGIITTYTITINPNYPNSVIQEYELEHGKQIEKPADPKYDHHRFLGWFNRDGKKVNLPFYTWTDYYVEAHWELIINDYKVRDLLAMSETEGKDFVNYEVTMTDVQVALETEYTIDLVGPDANGQNQIVTIYKDYNTIKYKEYLNPEDYICVKGTGTVVNGHYSIDATEISEGLYDPDNVGESTELANDMLNPMSKESIFSVENGLNKFAFIEVEVLDTFIDFKHVRFNAKFPGDVIKPDKSNAITVKNGWYDIEYFRFVQSAYLKAKRGSLIFVPAILHKNDDNSIDAYIVKQRDEILDDLYCVYGNSRVFTNHQDLLEHGVKTRLSDEDIEKYIPNLDFKKEDGSLLNASLHAYARKYDRYELTIDFNSYDYASAATQLKAGLNEKGYTLMEGETNIYSKDNGNALVSVEETDFSLRLKFYLHGLTLHHVESVKNATSYEGIQEKIGQVRDALSFNYSMCNFMLHGRLSSALPNIGEVINTTRAHGLNGIRFDATFADELIEAGGMTYDQFFRVQNLTYYPTWSNEDEAQLNFNLFEHDLVGELLSQGFTYSTFMIASTHCFFNKNTGELIDFMYFYNNENGHNHYELNISIINLDRMFSKSFVDDKEEYLIYGQCDADKMASQMKYLSKHQVDHVFIMPDVAKYNIQDAYFDVRFDHMAVIGIRAEFRCADKTVEDDYIRILNQAGFNLAENSTNKYKNAKGTTIYVEYIEGSLVIHYMSYVR